MLSCEPHISTSTIIDHASCASFEFLTAAKTWGLISRLACPIFLVSCPPWRRDLPIVVLHTPAPTTYGVCVSQSLLDWKDEKNVLKSTVI